MSIRYTRVYLLGWLLTMTIGLVCADAADVYLSISRGGGQRLRLAIPDFIRADGGSGANGGLGHEMARVLADDLRIYRFFDLIDNEKFLQEAAQADARAGGDCVQGVGGTGRTGARKGDV